MATFLTGATGYLGSYLAAGLLRRKEKLNLLVRAKDEREAEQRLWRSLQLHFDFVTFRKHLAERVHVFRGDITLRGCGLDAADLGDLLATTDSVLHCAASLHRRSERSCLNVNGRGTLTVIRLARAAHDRRALRRFGLVSTVSVAGERLHETVREDEAIDWSRRDYDAYGRTKKLAEHLVRELLPDVPVTVFRPSIILGDSTRPETTQFDMVRACSLLASSPVLPFRPTDRLDIVPADWVSEAILCLHEKKSPDHATYHLSAGAEAETYARLTSVIAPALGRRSPTFLPALERPCEVAARALARIGRGRWRRAAALLHAFYPYLTYDTVFDNTRAVAELRQKPTPFSSYCIPLLQFAHRNGFAYPYASWAEPRGALPRSDHGEPVEVSLREEAPSSESGSS
jgi:thioester reductase-like protein